MKVEKIYQVMLELYQNCTYAKIFKTEITKNLKFGLKLSHCHFFNSISIIGNKHFISLLKNKQNIRYKYALNHKVVRAVRSERQTSDCNVKCRYTFSFP